MRDRSWCKSWASLSHLGILNRSVCFNWLLSFSLYHGLGKSSLDVQVNTSTFLPFCSWIRELFLSSHALELLRVRSMHQLRSLFLPFSSRLELISLSFGEFCSNLACTNYDDFVSYEKFKHICSSHFSWWYTDICSSELWCHTAAAAATTTACCVLVTPSLLVHGWVSHFWWCAAALPLLSFSCARVWVHDLIFELCAPC